MMAAAKLDDEGLPEAHERIWGLVRHEVIRRVGAIMKMGVEPSDILVVVADDQTAFAGTVEAWWTEDVVTVDGVVVAVLTAQGDPLVRCLCRGARRDEVTLVTAPVGEAVGRARCRVMPRG